MKSEIPLIKAAKGGKPYNPRVHLCLSSERRRRYQYGRQKVTMNIHEKFRKKHVQWKIAWACNWAREGRWMTHGPTSAATWKPKDRRPTQYSNMSGIPIFPRTPRCKISTVSIIHWCRTITEGGSNQSSRYCWKPESLCSIAMTALHRDYSGLHHGVAPAAQSREACWKPATITPDNEGHWCNVHLRGSQVFGRAILLHYTPVLYQDTSWKEQRERLHLDCPQVKINTWENSIRQRTPTEVGELASEGR